MSKDRPFKNFKSPTERPFKVYNPTSADTNTSMLFQDPQQQEQPLRLGGLLNGMMSQQQQLHQHQQQQQQQMSFAQQQQQQQAAASGVLPQVYGDPEDYLHLNPQRLVAGQNPIMSLDPSLHSYYEELGLDDPDNPLIRPELLNDSILQREQDLNIGGSSSSTGVPGMSLPPSFLLQNGHHQHQQQQQQPQRGGVGAGSSSLSLSSTPPVSAMHESLSMLFDPSQPAINQFPTSSSSLHQHQLSLSQLHHQQQQQQQQHLAKSSSDRVGTSSSDLSGDSSTNRFLVSAVGVQSSALADMMAGGGGSNGGNQQQGGANGRPGINGDVIPSSSSINIDSSFPIKREADEGQAGLTDDSPSPSSIQSPSQSDSFGDSPSKANRNVKRSHSDSNGGSGQDQASYKRDKNRDSGDSSDTGSKDPGYLEKRRKNNESAKRSREARRNKEELVALRVITLEEENMKLRAEISLLDKELDELRSRLFS